MSLRRHIGIGLLLLLGAQPSVADSVTEAEVKLALVYNMTRFVSWPDTAGSEEFELCLAGESAYEIADENLTGRKIGDRDIRVSLLVEGADSADSCDLVYVSHDEADRARVLLERFEGLPVLMVSDAPAFIEEGGMVGLSIDDGRVGMKINVAAYESVGLTISSQLLELAQVIDDGQRAGG